MYVKREVWTEVSHTVKTACLSHMRGGGRAACASFFQNILIPCTPIFLPFLSGFEIGVFIFQKTGNDADT
jgi:hypothetical protein